MSARERAVGRERNFGACFLKISWIESVPMAHTAEEVLAFLDKLDVKTMSVSTGQMNLHNGLSDDMDEKERDKVLRLYRRKIANRESAKRSKIRKKAEDAKLLSAAETLLNDSASMRQTIKDLQRKVDELYGENVKLRRKLGEEVNDELEQSCPSVNLPPEVETPSLVMKEARKKKRGMMKCRSDSSIATTFGEEFRNSEMEDPVPVPARRAEQTVSEVAKQTPNTQITEKSSLNSPRDGWQTLFENFFMQKITEWIRNPTFADNFTMYDFKEGEIVKDDFSSCFRNKSVRTLLTVISPADSGSTFESLIRTITVLICKVTYIHATLRRLPLH